MTSFIYQREPLLDQQQFNVISSMNRERQYQNVESAQKSQKSGKKSLILHQSSSKLKKKNKETNRDKGLTYSSKILDFGGYEEEEDGGRKDRSLKIDCSGPADIIADIQDLNYEYVPKKKAIIDPPSQNAKVQKVRKVNNVQNLESNSAQKNIHQIVNDLQSKEKLEQSWDKVEQRRKKVNLFWFIFFLLILLSLTSHKARQLIFSGYSKIRKSIF